MNIKVWYKVPTPPIEGGPEGMVVGPNHLIATRIYRGVSMHLEAGTLVIEDRQSNQVRAVYKDFDFVEPID